MRTTPSQNGHVTDLLFLDEAYEKMACIYCQGNPILSLINKLLVMIGPALVKNQATFWNRSKNTVFVGITNTPVSRPSLCNFFAQMTPWMICSTNYEFNLEMPILQWLPRTPEFSFIGMWRRSTLLTDDLDLHMPLPLTLCQVTALSPPAAVGLLTCVPRSRYPVRVSNSIFNNIPIVVIHTRYGILHFFLIRHSGWSLRYLEKSNQDHCATEKLAVCICWTIAES